MIMVDQRLSTFVLPYADLERIIFHTGGELWMEIRLADNKQHLMPANMLAEGVIYLKVTNAFFTEKFKLFKALKESGAIPDSLRVERTYEACSYAEESTALKNFEVNVKYNKAYSSDFYSFSFQEPAYRELLEYHTMGEFNKVRGKDFISFASFHSVYTEANKK